MPTLVKATALAAATILVSDLPSTAACHHFSIWRFPWPQRCTTETVGSFIHEPPPTRNPAPPLKPTQDEEWQRQQAIEKLKGQLNPQKQQEKKSYIRARKTQNFRDVRDLEPARDGFDSRACIRRSDAQSEAFERGPERSIGSCRNKRTCARLHAASNRVSLRRKNRATL
jgi:hypothetical protein